MKSQVILGLPCLAAAFLSVSGLLAQPVTGDLPHAVQFELGKSEFAPGDGITILQMRGTSEVIKVGEPIPWMARMNWLPMTERTWPFTPRQLEPVG